MSENRTTEIRRSQEPSVIHLFFLSLPMQYLNDLNFLLEQTFTNLPGCKDHGQDLLGKMPTSQSLPCFVLKLFFFFSKLLLVFSFFFCSLCFNCAQEMVDHHHHLFLWKNLGCAHRARHYSLASLVPQLDEIIFSQASFFLQIVSFNKPKLCKCILKHSIFQLKFSFPEEDSWF